MHIERVAPMLQGVAAMRNWVVEHLPLTGSLLGFDLFIKLGNDLLGGAPLTVDGLAAGLPHPRAAVVEQLARMEQVGLLRCDARDGAIVPTAAFQDLLEQYAEHLERTFIPRDDLRRRQLLLCVEQPPLAEACRQIYDHMHDMGWLYLHNFGAACFMMAALVQRIASAHGHAARVASCYVEIGHARGRFFLGAQGYAKPGQVDGHAVCVLDEAVVVDFGLGNARRSHRRDFPWGIACDYRRSGEVMAETTVFGERVRWKDDWQSPRGQEELERYVPLVDGLYQLYARRFD